MRLLTVALAALVACSASAPPSASPTPERPTALRPDVTQSCSVPLAPLVHSTATAALLPHRIGGLAVFGLDGAFVASASTQPASAQRTWWEVDAAGATTREFEWDVHGRLSQSPDGSKVVYRDIDPATDEPALFIRELKGAPRLLARGAWSPRSWPDAGHLFVSADDDPRFVFAVDTTTLAMDVVFKEPEPPEVTQYYDDAWFLLSGDGKWSVFLRDNDDDVVIESHLFDVKAETFVEASLPIADVSLAPRGDVMAWLDGNELRAMHLCDRKSVTLADVGASAAPVVGGIRWSPDGRFLSIAYGVTDDLSGPVRIVVADLRRGVVAELAQPWGLISRWSPDGSYVVLSRGTTDRLARLTFP